MKNSGASLTSSRATRRELVVLGLSLLWLVAASAAYCFRNGFVLFYGDALAHLNISRSIIDSRTPGYDQLGTVWLPLLHVLSLPFVGNAALWSSGLAGTIPAAGCLVIASLFFYAAARTVYRDWLAAVVVLTCFALNPNLLYLASIPMTEVVFLAGLAAVLFAGVKFERQGGSGFWWLGIFASWWMSLTRYEGWFLIPFAALWFGYSARKHRIRAFFAFASLASLVPAYWLAHDWYETGNALDFYNGPYSPSAIQGSGIYPGYHNWLLAAIYYGDAARLCAGTCLLLAGAAGLWFSRRRPEIRPILFLLLPLFFYVWSIHSSKVPVFVPDLWPHSYYNTRYGIVAVAWAAFAAGSLVTAIPRQWHRFAVIIPFLAVCPWLFTPNRDHVVCWKESQVNSAARRAWTEPAAGFFRSVYQPGEGILASFGDAIGIFSDAKIPLREVLHIGNGPEWLATTSRPDLVHREVWAVAQQGDALSRSLRNGKRSPYRVVRSIAVPGAPALLIFRREDK